LATANDRDPVMKFFPATSRTVFGCPPAPQATGPTSAGALRHRISLKAMMESSGPRLATNSFTRPPMPCPNSCPPHLFRPYNRFHQVTAATDAPSHTSLGVSSPPDRAFPKQVDLLESTASPNRVLSGILANVRRLFDTNLTRGSNLQPGNGA
jgi:hypothetical protein